jgi:RNA polymerase sigma-70 factor, ECF subfamily
MTLLERLRDGDGAAFATLVDGNAASMLRVARMHVASEAVAQEVVQETWLAVLQGLDRFEERSSLRTWIFHILVNRARTRGAREARTVPFATLAAREADEPFAAVDADRFLPADDPEWPGHWAAPLPRWDEVPERHLAAREAATSVRGAMAALPPMQRIVMIMRDVEGWEAPEICHALDISESNQRVLLHRARSRVRASLEREMADELI